MWRLWIALLLIATLNGCGLMDEPEYTGRGEGDYGYGTPKELGTLLNRRDAEDAIADRDRMITEITAELARVVPGTEWRPNRDPLIGTCGDFGSTNGQTYTSRHYVSDLPVPAKLWQTASQTVIDIAARYGYTNIIERSENPKDGESVDLSLSDPDGGYFTFGSMKAATLYARTGCYLTAEEKRKARDAAPK